MIIITANGLCLKLIAYARWIPLKIPSKARQKISRVSKEMERVSSSMYIESLSDLEFEKKEAEDQERKKIEANKKAEAEALRIKNQAPDKDKLIEWVNGFSINEINISDKDIQEKKELINQKFNAFKKWALNQI